MSDEQRTEEWFKDRAGKFTGSRFADVMARNKKTGAPLKAYEDLIWQVVADRLSCQPEENMSGYAQQWGEDVEPMAREAYEIESGNAVTLAGFITHPVFSFAGCSPDGLIGDDGGLEMKCPKSRIVHLSRFLDGVPEEYIPQIQGCMWVTGRAWWDFVSFDPRMPGTHQILIIRVERDQEYIDKLQAAVIEAEAKALDLHEQLIMKAAA